MFNYVNTTKKKWDKENGYFFYCARIPVGARFFHVRADRPRGPQSPLYNGYIKYHPPRSSAEVLNGLELYVRLPSVTAQARHGLTFTFTNA